MNLEYLIFDDSIRSPERIMNYKNPLRVLLILIEQGLSDDELKRAIEDLYYGDTNCLGGV